MPASCTAFCGTRDVDEITAELGTTWEIPEVTFKLYPVCAFNQIPVAAAVRASERAGLAVDEIDRVEVEINDYELGYPGMDRAEDFSTVSQTLMSTRFTIAVGLLTGGVAYDDLRRFDDADAALAGRSHRCRSRRGAPADDGAGCARHVFR